MSYRILNNMKPGSCRRKSLAGVVMGLVILLCAAVALAQSSSFTYQGKLTDGGTAANGNYDLQFALWDRASGGTQIGSTQTINAVAVSNGDFAVTLDFGAASFNGADRFVEISARLSGSGNPFIVQTPRTQITSAPYAIRSLSAGSADNVTVTGVPSGSGNYIQNSASQQPASNFNISGNGTAAGTLSASIVNADAQFNITGLRVLSSSRHSGNLAVGMEAGTNLTDQGANSLFGSRAGYSTVGGYNSFFGYGSGESNTAGGNNLFLGAYTGTSNTTGSNNTLIGAAAQVGSGNLTSATAIGAWARVDQSNSLVLGNSFSELGQLTNVGIGTTTPRSALEVKRNWDGSFGAITVTGDRPTIRFSGGTPANNDQWIIHLGSAAGTAPAGSLSFFFGGTAGTSYGAPAFSVTPGKTVQIPNLAAGGGSTQLCRNGSSEITTCNSSSLRYKTNVAAFSGGLDLINRLRPISFTWKRDSTNDVGFGAEEVEKVAPLFTFRNDQGEIEGVRYDRLSVLFVNAFKEQQQQIKTLREANAALNARLRNLELRRRKKVVSSRSLYAGARSAH